MDNKSFFNKIEKLLKHKYAPFFMLWAFYLLVHLMLPAIFDDVHPSNTESVNSIFSTVKEVYFRSTSRVFISVIALFFLKYKVIWIVLNSFAVAFCGFLISYLFGDKNNAAYNRFVCLLMLLYPFLDMSTAGYIMTTSNYLWPLVFMLVSFIPLKKIYENTRIKMWEYFLYALALMLACNAEQVAAIVLITYLLFLIWLLSKNTVNLFVTLMFVLITAEILFIFTAPGNEVRSIIEASIWFADLDDLSLLNKADLAFSSSVYHYIFKPNAPFLMFFVLLFLTVWQKTKRLIPRFTSVVTACLLFFFGYTNEFAKYAVTKYGSVDACILLFMLLMCAGIVYLVYCCLDNRKTRAGCLFILAMGLLSKMVMVMSPTIWGSQTRTFIYFNFAFLIAAFLIYIELKKTNFSAWRPFCIFSGTLAAVCLLVFLSYGTRPAENKVFLNSVRDKVRVHIIRKYDLLGNYARMEKPLPLKRD